MAQMDMYGSLVVYIVKICRLDDKCRYRDIIGLGTHIMVNEPRVISLPVSAFRSSLNPAQGLNGQ